MLLTLPDVKYSQDEIKELDLKTSSQKSITIKSQLLTGPRGRGGGGRKESHGFHGEGRRGGRIVFQNLRGD